MKAAMEVRGTPRRLTPEVESVLFRIAQEALTNVAKHAGANSVKVELDFSSSSILLNVTDDGIGFSPEAVLRPEARRKSWGLLGMRERADLVGGQCEIAARPRHGTRVSVRVPLRGAIDT
jgi:signal transduction histidine kinase